MEKINILFTSKRPQIQFDYLRRHLEDDCNFIFPSDYCEESILEHIKEADVLVGDYITESMLNYENIKLIQVPIVGVEKLNFELQSKFDIPVCNSHSNALAVAETAVALLLSIAKKIPYHDKLLRKGDWNKTITEDSKESLSMYNSYISNSTVGFVGYGNIAKKITSLLKGFNCKFMAIVTDKNKKYDEISFLGDISDLDYVLANVDYLVVAAPLTPKTKGMLNMNNLTKMKNTAYIINISRGKVIDEESLYYILSENLIRGAAIDVWYNYPTNNELTLPSANYDFHKLDNIIMTPHRADLMYDGFPYLDDAIDNIKAFKEGKGLKNILDLTKGY